MAVMLAGAWLWSAVLTVTASISLAISSNILRQSVYFLAWLNSLDLPPNPRPLSSTSHSATTSPRDPAWLMSPEPLPPTPTPAKRRFSFGESPARAADTADAVSQYPAPAAAVRF